MAVHESETGDADKLKDEAERHSPIRTWLEGVRSTRTGALTLKIVIGVIGSVMVIGGLIMVPFPGPGWLVVFAGLAVLATEFHWAHKVLEFGKRILHSWTEWYKRQGLIIKVVVLVVTVAVAALIVYLGMKSIGIDLIDWARGILNV